MEEILHHLGCTNHVDNGMNYLSTGAGFLPSKVVIPTVAFFAIMVWNKNFLSAIGFFGCPC